MPLTGRCLCETISYEVGGAARDVVNCHCSRCRRSTGHFMAASAALADEVAISGATLTWYAPSADVEYGFCSRCGSTLFWRSTSDPHLLSIAAGTLDPPTGLGTVAAIYTGHASDYHRLDGSIPSHEEDA